jgi:hypothetical protein
MAGAALASVLARIVLVERTTTKWFFVGGQTNHVTTGTPGLLTTNACSVEHRRARQELEPSSGHKYERVTDSAVEGGSRSVRAIEAWWR